MIATIIYWLSTLSPMRLPKKVNIENTLIKYKNQTQRITTIIFSNIFNNLLFILLLFFVQFVQFLQIFSKNKPATPPSPRNKDLSVCGDGRRHLFYRSVVYRCGKLRLLRLRSSYPSPRYSPFLWSLPPFPDSHRPYRWPYRKPYPAPRQFSVEPALSLGAGQSAELDYSAKW